MLGVTMFLQSSPATALNVEVYYGPYCPNSANYMSMHLRQLLDADLPNVSLTVVPYAVDPATGAMPQPCPSRTPGTPCGALAAPLCALQPFVPGMPHALTTDFKQAINFAFCDLVHANPGAPAELTHTMEDMATCAGWSGADWNMIQRCMENVAPSGAYVEKISSANGRLPPGKTSPFVFVDGQFTENTEPLLPRVCRAVAPIPTCEAALANKLFTSGRLHFRAHHGTFDWMLPACAFGVVTGAALLLSLSCKSRPKTTLRDESTRRLVAGDCEDEDSDAFASEVEFGTA